MPSFPARAVVLRTFRLGEADRIVVLLSAEGRQIRAVAKGSRKSLSRLAGRVQPYVVGDLLIAVGRSLDVISEMEVLSAHDALRSDLDRCAGASAVSELADRLTSDSSDEPPIYELTVATLDAMETSGPEGTLVVAAAYYAKALAMHGWRPQLAACASCGGRVSGGRFSAVEGGVLCLDCQDRDPTAPAIDEATRTLVLTLLRSRFAELAELHADPLTVRRALLLLRDFAAYHVGSRLKAPDFLLGLPGRQD